MMILRYPRLYLSLVRFSVSQSLEFRVNFWFRVLMDVVYAAITILFYEIIYGRFDSFAGWSRSEALVFVAACLIVDAIQMTFFSDNLNSFAEKIRQGDLDYYLVRPVSPLFLITLRQVSLNSAINLIISIALLVVYLGGIWSEISTSRLVMFILLIINGGYLYYLTRLLFVLPIFWLGSIRGLDALFYNLYYCVDRPDAIFRGPVRLILTTLIPFSIMASFPSRVLFNEDMTLILLHTAAVTIGLTLLVRWIWKKGLRSYSSASS